MSHKTILIIGAGIMQEPAIMAAKKKGWTVVALDGNKNAECKDLADCFDCVDLQNFPDVLNVAIRYQSQLGLDGVFTAGTDLSNIVAYIAEQLHLPGIPYETALNCTNKYMMRVVLHGHRVKQPKSFLEVNVADGKFICGNFTFPVVVKPVDNMGARGVRKVSSNKNREYEKWLFFALNYSKTGEAIVEEFVKGKEYSLDAIIWKDEITICGIAERLIQHSPFFVEMGYSIPAKLNKDIEKEIVETFKKAIRALGITEGAAKGDIKYTKDGAVVIEIAARLSGGYMSGWTYPYSSGVDVTSAALNIAVGLPPGNLDPEFTKYITERSIISKTGIVKKISGVQKAKNMVGVKDVFIRVKRGDQVKTPTNNVEKCGSVIACATSRKESIEIADLACKAITIKVL